MLQGRLSDRKRDRVVKLALGHVPGRAYCAVLRVGCGNGFQQDSFVVQAHDSRVLRMCLLPPSESFRVVDLRMVHRLS